MLLPAALHRVHLAPPVVQNLAQASAVPSCWLAGLWARPGDGSLCAGQSLKLFHLDLRQHVCYMHTVQAGQQALGCHLAAREAPADGLGRIVPLKEQKPGGSCVELRRRPLQGRRWTARSRSA